MIAVSEGMCDADGETWAKKIAQTAEKDPHGNIQLSGTGALADFLAAQVKNNLKIKRVRADTFGYLQRSFPGFQSPVDADEARRCGREAVQYAMSELSGSVAIKRTGNGKKYGVELFRTELKNVAEKTKSHAGRVHQRRRQRRHDRPSWSTRCRWSGNCPRPSTSAAIPKV